MFLLDSVSPFSVDYDFEQVDNATVFLLDSVSPFGVYYYFEQADIVVLTTSEENGLCYIETAELDG